MNPVFERLRQTWLVAMPSSTLRNKPLGVSICGTPLVLGRVDHQIVVAVDRCPHRNAPLSKGFLDSGRLVCPYHGWAFDPQGGCVHAPGLSPDHLPCARLSTWRVFEGDGLIWVATPDTPESKTVERSPFAVDPQYESHLLTSELDTSLVDALENLLDGTHTPWVHSGLVRTKKTQQAFTAIVRRKPECIEAEYRGEARQSGLISKWFERERSASFGRYIPPCSAQLEYRSSQRVELFVEVHFTPATQGKVQVFATTYLPKGKMPRFVRRPLVRWFFGKVMRQDRDILKMQYDNVARFGKPAYTHWPADLLRPWIDAWLKHGEFPDSTDGPQVTHFLL